MQCCGEYNFASSKSFPPKPVYSFSDFFVTQYFHKVLCFFRRLACDYSVLFCVALNACHRERFFVFALLHIYACFKRNGARIENADYKKVA